MVWFIFIEYFSLIFLVDRSYFSVRPSLIKFHHLTGDEKDTEFLNFNLGMKKLFNYLYTEKFSNDNKIESASEFTPPTYNSSVFSRV